MKDKNWIEQKSKSEAEDQLQKKDYFQQVEERKMKEELDSLLRSTNPLNKEKKLTAEEVGHFYNTKTRRRKKKKYQLKEKMINVAILGAGIILVFGIMWIAFNSIQSLFNNRENELAEASEKRIEVLNMQISQLQEENNGLSSENQQLQTEVEKLKSQIPDQPSSISSDNSQSNKTENPTETEVNDEGRMTYYTVQEGDTLWKISQKLYGTGKHYKQIMDYNDIKDENDLIKGTRLAIPKL